MANSFSPAAKKALVRLGDIYLPGDQDMPAFSAAGGIKHVDKYIANAPADDIASLNIVLVILSIMPGFVLRWLVKKLSTAAANNGPLGTILRQLNIGIRGLLFSCYFNDDVGVPGKRPIDIIGFNVNRVYN